MPALILLVLVMSPLLAALAVSDVEARLLMWYLVEAGLIVVLLSWRLLRERRWPHRLALLSGVALHVATVGCGVLTDSGACDSEAGLPGAALASLVILGVVAEVVARMEQRRWARGTSAKG